jgi:signal transduction histidine kinase
MKRALQVLLIEDNPADARLVELALQEMSYPAQITHTLRLSDALRLLKGSSQHRDRHQKPTGVCGFDVVLVDLQLPDSQGLETLAQVHEAAPETPIIALTGLADEELALRSLQSGATDYLFKGPSSDGLLERSIRYAIERKRSERSRLDLARAQAARAEAEAANRAKDQFMAVLSHELRTPLNAILGWASLLGARTLDEQTQRQALATIERNARAQAQLIDDLLDVSRIITGKLSLELSLLDLGEVIDHAVGALRPQMHLKNQSLRREPDRTALIEGDAVRLQQVVWNLLSNAIKFTPENGEITIRLAHEEASSPGEPGTVALTIEDTGQGIGPDFLPHIFDRFRQADGSTTRRHGGLGLGLAIVRHLVEAHGGTISAESEGVGKGARFTMRVPAAEESSAQELAAIVASDASKKQAGPDEGEALGSPLLEAVKVLAVDDQEDARELLLTALSSCGADVRIADSAEEALETVVQWRPDIVISDVGMPQIDGYELIRLIRSQEDPELKDIPAIAVTGYARPEERDRAREAGFQTFLAKPVDPAELILATSRLTQRD